MFKFLRNKPNANIYELYDEFRGYPARLLQAYKWEFRKKYIAEAQAHQYKKELEFYKNYLILLFNVLNFKATLNAKLKKEEKIALEELEKWCHYEDYKKDLVKKKIDSQEL